MDNLVKLTQQEYGLLLSKSLVLHALIDNGTVTPEALQVAVDSLEKKTPVE